MIMPSPVGAQPQNSKKKLLLITPKNPEKCTQIKRPTNMTAKHEDEVAAHEAKREKKKKKHQDKVERLIYFLQSHGHTVAYEQQLKDKYVPSKLLWLQEEVNIADYVLLIITHSLNLLLGQGKVPDEEDLFVGDYMQNLVSGLVKKPDGSKVKFVCVFLDGAIRKELLPPARVGGNTYCLMEPFELQEGRNDDIHDFMTLLGRKSLSNYHKLLFTLFSLFIHRLRFCFRNRELTGFATNNFCGFMLFIIVIHFINKFLISCFFSF